MNEIWSKLEKRSRQFWEQHMAKLTEEALWFLSSQPQGWLTSFYQG